MKTEYIRHFSAMNTDRYLWQILPDILICAVSGYCDKCCFLDIIIGIFYNIFTKFYWGKTWKQFLLQMMKRILGKVLNA